MNQFLIKVPKDEILEITEDGWNSTLPDDAVQRILDVKGKITSNMLFGTRTYYDYKLIVFIGAASLTKVISFIEEFNLSWTIMAATSNTGDILHAYDPNTVIKFMESIVERDNDGNITDTYRPTEITSISGFDGFPRFYAVGESMEVFPPED